MDKSEAGKTEKVDATEFFLPWIERGKDACYQWISTKTLMEWKIQEPPKLEQFGTLIHEQEDYIFENERNMRDILLSGTNIWVMVMINQMKTREQKIQEKLDEARDAASSFIVYVADREYRGPSHIIQLVADINDPGNSWTFSVSPDEMDEVKSVSELLARIPPHDGLSPASLMAKENTPACFPVRLKHMKNILMSKPTKYPEIPRELNGAKLPSNRKGPNVTNAEKHTLMAYELHEVLGHGYITPTAHSVVYTSKTIEYAFVQKDIAVFVCTYKKKEDDSMFFAIYHLTDSSCVLDSRRPDAEVRGKFIGATFNKFHKMIIVAYKHGEQEYLRTFHLGNSQLDIQDEECEASVTRLGHVSLNYMAVGDQESESVFGINENGSIDELICENWMLEKLPHLKRYLRVDLDRSVYWDDEGVWEITQQTSDDKNTLAVSAYENANDQAEDGDSANSSTRDRDACLPQIQPRMLKLAAKKAATNPLLEKFDTQRNVESVLLQCFPVLVTTDGCLVRYNDKHFVLFRPDVSERLLDVRLRQFYRVCLSSVSLFAIEKFLCETKCQAVHLLTVIDIFHGRSSLDIDRLFRTSFASISVNGVSVALTKLQYQNGDESLWLVVYFNEDSNAALEAVSSTAAPVILCGETRNRAQQLIERQGKAKQIWQEKLGNPAPENQSPKAPENQSPKAPENQSPKAPENQSPKAPGNLCPMAPENLRDHNEIAKILTDDRFTAMNWEKLLNSVKQMIARYLTHKTFTTVPLRTISKFC